LAGKSVNEFCLPRLLDCHKELLLCRRDALEVGVKRSSVASDESSYREFERIEVFGLGEAALKIDLKFPSPKSILAATNDGRTIFPT
jgi:hypothetical protein